jgi:hypothetical protein
MNLQEIKAHILDKIGGAPAAQLRLDNEHFPVDGIDELHDAMKIGDFDVQVAAAGIDIHADGYLLVPVQQAKLTFGPGLSLISSAFEVRIHENGATWLEWEGGFDQFAFDGLHKMGWLPETIELPQLSFAELALNATTHQNGQAPHYALGARLTQSFDIIPDLGAGLDGGALAFKAFTDDSPSQFELSGQLRVGESLLNIVIAIPTTVSGPWTFHLQSADAPFSLEDLFQLVGGVNIFQELPGELNISDLFALRELYIEYDFATRNLNTLRTVIGLGDWDLFEEMSIRNAFVSFELTNPFLPERQIDTLIGGEYAVGNAANLTVELFIPSDGADWELKASGGLGGDGQGFLSAVSGDIDVAQWLPEGLSDPALVVNEFYLRFNPAKRKILQTRVSVGIDAEWVIVGELLSLGHPYLAFDIVFPQIPNAKAQVNALLGGEIGIAESTLHVLAARDASKTWRFLGKLEGDLPLLATAKQFLDIDDTLPFGLDNLTLNVLEAEIVVPPKTQQPNSPKPSFRFAIGASDLWSIDIGDFTLDAEAVIFAIERNSQGQTLGKISGAVEFNGMNFTASYAFGPGRKELALDWEGIAGTYTSQQADSYLTLTVNNKSIGDIISMLVRVANPGLGAYRLPEPWDFLDKIYLNFTLTYWIKGPKKGQLEFTYTFPEPLDLVIIQITGIGVTRIGKSVTISILGLDHPTWDAAKQEESPPPQVPGLAERLIDLRLLAMGRHVSLRNPGQVSNMKEAIAALREFTLPTSEGLPDTVIFNPRSNWLAGIDFGLLQMPPYAKPADPKKPFPVYGLQLSALFNDPDIYGMRIEVNGDKIPPLKGLKFEILYTKITDSIGKYHLELVLPDILRYIEMGSVSLVMPVIVIDIFTNGDFFIDIGFPYEFDFSRSFSITIIIYGVPVLGSGGFYIGKYSPATLPRPVPVSFFEEYDRAVGEFNPTMVFGLGLQVGVGKYFKKGPLTARFSLTLAGLIEGIVATFNPANELPQATGKDINKSNYVYLRGAIGIIGILEGAVDFKVIKAHVLIRLQVIVQAIYESYCVMPLSLSAGVTVKVSIKIDLGLFDITIHFSFSATITASFDVGEDRHLEAPWFQRPAQARSLFAAARGLQGPLLDLTHLPIPAAPKQKLSLYATLQPTVAWDAEKKPASQLVFNLVLQAPAEGQSATGNTPFEKITDSVYAWVAQQIYKNGAEANTGQLRQLLEELRGDSLDILPYASLLQHLQEQFDLDILYPTAQQSITAAPFPVFPFLHMEVKDGDKTRLVDFAAFGRCSEDYLRFLSDYFEAAMTRPDDPDYQPASFGSDTVHQLSLTEQLFEDYFLSIARGMVEETIGWMEESKKAGATLSEALAALRARNAAARIAGQLARFYMGGQRLPKNAGLQLAAEPATFDDRFGIFQVTGQQFPQAGTGAPVLRLFTAGSLPAGWTLPAAAYTAPPVLLQRLTALAAEAAAPPAYLSKNLLAPFQRPPRRYPLTRAIDWESNDAYLLEFPENLLRQLAKNAAAISGLRIEKPHAGQDGSLIVDDSTQQPWQGATLVQFGIRKTATPFAYEIIGADEAGIALLEKVILDNPAWEELHLCYQPYQQGLRQTRLESPAASDFLAFIAQINLSTETNPIEARGLMARARSLAPSGVLDGKDFIGRLWAASITRTGGHYLYFQKQDGDGLPADLFGQDGTAHIQLLIRFGQGAPRRYMNYAVTGRGIDVQNDVVFARDPNFADQVNELPAGHLLLEATRNRPSGDSANTLAHLFHLLSWQVQGGENAAFQSATLQLGAETEAISSSPISPTEEENPARWRYEQIVPAARFAKPEGLLFSGGPSFPQAGLPGPAHNPYAGVGRPIAVQLQTRDVYGNAIPDREDQVAASNLHYTDPLIPLHQWPEAQCSLELRSGAVVVNLALLPQAGLSRSDLRKNREYYQKIYFQLFSQDPGGAAHLRADLRSSLLGDDLNAAPETSPDLNLLLQLRSFAARAYDYFNKKAGDPNNPVSPPAVELKRSFTADQVNGATVFELLTELQLRRTAHVHPELASEEAVFLARTPLKPISASQEVGSGNWEAALRKFATAFEAAFPELKLATGFDKEELDNYEQRKDLFLVRTGRFQWTNGEPVTLALPPLSTRLLDRAVNVGQYSKEQGWQEAESNQQAFTGVDMDDWARLFFEAFDNLLSPEMAGAIYLLDKEALERLLQTKKTLAEAVAGKLKPVLDGQSGNVQTAAEKLKQRLLQQLSQAYEVNAVVQYPVAFASPHSGDEIRLYGAPSIRQNSAGQRYTLSTTKMPSKSASQLDFLFTTKTARQESSVKLDLEFKTTHLEYRITENDRFEGYQASSWLSFVIPPAPASLGSVDIPIVLRDFPEAPVLLAQAARQSDDLLPGMTAKEALRVATGWDYLIRYNQRLSAQDWLQAEIRFNLPEARSLRARSVSRDLFDVLAAFAHHWPALQADLRSLLPQVTPQSIGQLPEETRQQALNAIAAFEAMARLAADTWAEWTPPRAVLMGFGQDPAARIFSLMEEKGANGKLVVKYQNHNSNTDPGIPQPLLLVGPDELRPTAQNGLEHPYGAPYEQANAQPLRAIALEQLNVLAWQNAVAAVYLSRNEMLVDGRKSDESFVYYTPQTRFPNPIVPLLSNDIEVNIGELLPGKNSLLHYLNRFFLDLFENVHFGSGERRIGMQLECSYAYKLSDDPAQPFVRLPIALAPYRGFNPEEDAAISSASFAGQLAREIQEWLDAEQPAAGNAAARLLFDLAVFSTTSSNRQPILRLRNVVLGMGEMG